jgi:hypothetical protein
VFVPSYPVSRTYVNNVNISNTRVTETVINNYYNTTIVNKNVTVNNVRYVNQSVPGAVTATTPKTFTSAQPVGRNMVQVNEKEVASAPPVVRAPATVPQKQSVLGSGAATNVHPPATVQNRAVVAKTTPPPPPPSFAAHQQAIQKNNGQPISVAQTRQLESQQTQARTTPTPVKIAPPSKPAAPKINNLQQGGNKANDEPGPVNTNRPNNNAQPNKPSGAGGNQTNASTRAFQDRPPASRPTPTVNPQLEQKHQQENQNLQQKQDQEYQKLQQQQAQEQQKLRQQQADQEKQQQIQQKQQQEREQLQQKQQQQQQQLQQKQEAEHQKAYKEPPAPKEQSKPKSDDKHHK